MSQVVYFLSLPMLKVRRKIQSQSLPRFRYLPSILSEQRKEQAHSRSTSPLMTLQQEELDNYLSTTVQVDERLDPVQFGISSEQTYPHIAPLACDLLTIPASSAPVERTFSTAGEVTSGKRNRLSDKSLERSPYQEKQVLPIIHQM